MDALVEKRVQVQFKSEVGEKPFPPFDIPLSVTSKNLQSIWDAFSKEEDKTPYSFFVENNEIVNTLEEVIKSDEAFCENLIQILCVPQAIFDIKPVTRCSSTLSGHLEPILVTQFSPDSNKLATGSGDKTIRLWDLCTETPFLKCEGHTDWVLCISWAPDAKKFASASKDCTIRIWNPKSGEMLGNVLKGHCQWINALAWEPFHLNTECRKLASASKDTTIRIWDVKIFTCLFACSSHSQSVTDIKWGGSGLLYSSSQDTTIKVWRASDGVLCRELKCHGHWVNSLALNTEYAMRIALFCGDQDSSKNNFSYKVNNEESVLQANALKMYNNAKGDALEKLVSASDDFTLCLWHPEESKKEIARMTGHQQLINDVKFSPDGRIIASASFDKSVRLWNGKNGEFIKALRGHVSRVYQLAWSKDSRLLLSSSADSTLKVWSMKKKFLEMDLPGHEDEVYSIDWSPDGEKVASGGKDKKLKIWKN